MRAGALIVVFVVVLPLPISGAAVRDVAGVWSVRSGAPLACAWGESGGRVDGACVLDAPGGAAEGVYRVMGRRRGRSLRVEGTRPDGARLRARFCFDRTTATGQFRVRGTGVHARGAVTLARTSADAADPGWLYGAACGGCHGADARGSPGRPAIRCSVHAEPEARAGLRNGMPAFPAGELSSADLASIASWLAALCATDGPDALPADLYASNCARCHGADGAGTSNVSGLQGPEIRCRSRELLLSELSGAEGGMPDFSDLSDAQAQTITTFVRGLCPGPLPPY